jgi:hypothetical protein
VDVGARSNYRNGPALVLGARSRTLLSIGLVSLDAGRSSCPGEGTTELSITEIAVLRHAPEFGGMYDANEISRLPERCLARPEASESPHHRTHGPTSFARQPGAAS